MNPSVFVVLAAGGNPTAIQIVDGPRERAWYEAEGRALMERTSEFGPEQVGFLDVAGRHFEMGGGEFCGNAARAAAMLLANVTGQSEFAFTMSGYEGPVDAKVGAVGNGFADVACNFSAMRPEARPVRLHDVGDAKVVDLGGIVHVLVEGSLPADYESRHRAITEELGYGERSAVGVCWILREGERVTLHPVVWVRSIDTFFYETACGSGSIAAAAATGAASIVQPNGNPIMVMIGPDGVLLRSLVEVSHAS